MASIQQSLHALADALAQAFPPASQPPSPFPPTPAPSRQAFRATVADARAAAGRFRAAVWDAPSASSAGGAGDDETKVKAAGSMREWATNTSILALLPSLPQLATLTPSAPSALANGSGQTPFALPPATPLPSLLETRAKRLGLEVYRETLVDDDDGPKEVLVLGGKTLVLELELVPAPAAPIATAADGQGQGQALGDASDIGRWALVKFATSLSIPGAAEPLPAPQLDAFLAPPLKALLALLSSPPLSSTPARTSSQTGESRELAAGRRLAQWEDRLRLFLAHETTFAARPAVLGEAARLSDLLAAGAPSQYSPEAADDDDDAVALFPTVHLSPTHKLTLVPSSNSPSSASPARLPFLASPPAASGAPTEPFLWEATFSPSLSLPVTSTSSSPSPFPSSSAATLVGLHPTGYWTPPPTQAAAGARAQAWSLEHAGSLDRLGVARVSLASAAEAVALVQWSRDWLWTLEFASTVLDGTPAFALPAVDGLTLDSLYSFSPDAGPTPISLALPSAVDRPSVSLTFPHPIRPVVVTVVLSPLPTFPSPSASTATASAPSARERGARITLHPQSLEALVGRARLDVLGSQAGSEGRAVVLWLLRRLAECAGEEQGEEEEGGREAKRLKVD